jgi:hypothetical protein
LVAVIVITQGHEGFDFGAVRILRQAGIRKRRRAQHVKRVDVV